MFTGSNPQVRACLESRSEAKTKMTSTYDALVLVELLLDVFANGKNLSRQLFVVLDQNRDVHQRKRHMLHGLVPRIESG